MSGAALLHNLQTACRWIGDFLLLAGIGIFVGIIAAEMSNQQNPESIRTLTATMPQQADDNQHVYIYDDPLNAATEDQRAINAAGSFTPQPVHN